MLLTIADIPAKSPPFQSVLTHSLVTGLTAQALVQSYLSEGIVQKLSNVLNISLDETERFAGYFTALHDIGKLAPEFAGSIASEELLSQMKAEGLIPYCPPLKYRHEKTTQNILTELWCAAGYHKPSVRFLSSVLGAHHQGKNGEEEKCISNWRMYHRELEQSIREFFYSSTPFELPIVQKQEQGFLGVVLLGLTILADWIASGDSFQDAETWVQQDGSCAQVQCRVARFLQESGLQRQELFGGSSFCSVWPNIPSDGMRSVQKELEQLFCQTDERLSLILVEAPMGEGKTEAGIYAALQMARQWEKNGFYIGLPTSATANQMVNRVRGLLALHKKEDQARLLHAMAWLVDHCTPENRPMDTEDAPTARRWLEPLRRGLLSSYAVGTVDQAMMAAMMIKYGVLRLLGLSGKVLIIDELHAYDVYMSEILTCLLQWCRELEIPVVLLSATLPPEKKWQMLSVAKSDNNQIYPAITAVTESGRLLVRSVPETARHQYVQVVLEPILHNPTSIAEKALQLIKHGGCACVLMNTVKQAQEVYQVLQRQDTEARLLLFHAQFPASRRDKLERECIRLFGKDKSCRPDKAILVATQVVEQSLDIDMDVLLTAVAPMDLLLQRTGRMFRHDDTPRPVSFTSPHLFVLVPENGDLAADAFVYPECLLRQSIYLLKDRKQIRIPEDLAQLVADGYDMEKAPQEELDAWLERIMEDQDRSSRGEYYTLGDPKRVFRPARERLDFDDLEQDSFLSAKTRMGEPSERIALLESDLYQQVEKRIQTRQGIPYVPVVERELARKVLEQSVSVRKKHLAGFQGICGERLLEGVQIFKAKQGTYTAPDGRTICFDPTLGVLWKKEG